VRERALTARVEELHILSLAAQNGSMRQIAQRAAAWLRGPEGPDEPGSRPDGCTQEELALEASEAQVQEATESLQPLELAKHSVRLSASRFRHAQQYWLKLQAGSGAVEEDGASGGRLSFPDAMPDYPFGVPSRLQAETRQARSQAAVTGSLAENDRTAYQELGGDKAWRAARAQLEAAIRQRDDSRIALQRCREGTD
jgi:hypothetical protein